jgi:hypothetical protein
VLLSRFWYVVLAVSLAGAMFLVYLATAISNRTSRTTAAQLLTAASQAVGWYLKDDARTRSAALIPLTFDESIREGLKEASKAETLKDVKNDLRDKASRALRSFGDASRNEGTVFDALWAIDRHGRVLANYGFEKDTNSEHFEMGGYALVADALSGWIRDDAWIFDGRIYRVVGLPVEIEVGGEPIGAIVGAKVVDDGYAQAISDRTGAAVAFYASATRVASGAPQAFDKSALEVHAADLEKVEQDPDYQEKGRTAARVLRETPGFDVTVIFARLNGEAWDLGAGYVVGHRQATVTDPFEFQRLATSADQEAVPLLWLVLAALAAVVLGLFFTVMEHSLPLYRFRMAAADLGDKRSGTDVLKPSTFRGVFKKIAAHVNDALDKIAAQAGVDRGVADLEGVLGPLPAQPQMSAFSVPKGAPRGEAGAVSSPEPMAPLAARAAPPAAMPRPKKSLPKPRAAAGPSGMTDLEAPGSVPVPMTIDSQRPPDGGVPDFTAALRGGNAPVDGGDEDEPTRQVPMHELHGAMGMDGDDNEDEETQWRRVYQEFLTLKRQLGEPTTKLTYDKFRGTLQRNKDALVARHNCRRVRFRVYEKQGRAALKASPVK